MKTVPLCNWYARIEAKRNLIMLGSLHTVFLDRSSHPLSLPTFHTVFLHLSLSLSVIPLPWLPPLFFLFHFPLYLSSALSRSFSVRVSTSSSGSVGVHMWGMGITFSKGNKNGTRSRFDRVCSTWSIFENTFSRRLYRGRTVKISLFLSI